MDEQHDGEPDPSIGVIRPAAGLPPGFLPPAWNGQVVIWQVDDDRILQFDHPLRRAVAEPTERYEVRDGQRVRVYEVRPLRRLSG